MQHTSKPFCPFGKVLHDLRTLVTSITFTPFIYCGRNAYTEAQRSMQNGQLALCLPNGTSVDFYRWPIKGIRVVLCDTGGMTTKSLSRAALGLLNQGASQVLLYSEDNHAMQIYSSTKGFK